MQEVKLWHSAFLWICRLTLAWISSENSTTHEECWLILTGLPSQRLDPISSDWSLRCPVSTGHSRHPSLTASPSSFFQLPTRVSSYFASRSRIQSPLSGFAPKQTKESSAWRTTNIVSHIDYGRQLYLLFQKIYHLLIVLFWMQTDTSVTMLFYYYIITQLIENNG